MEMASKDYLRMVEENRRKHLRLTKRQYKLIRDLFEDAAKELEEKALKAKQGSLTQRWALDYKKSAKETVKSLTKQLKTQILADMKTSADLGAAVQMTLFELIDDKYNLGVSESFRNVFSRVPKEALEELIGGSYYNDGKGLSKRIWFTEGKVNGDIDYIIQQAMAQKKSAVELAKDLEMYVNPNAVKSFDLGKVYPNLRGKQIEYNAMRLARTTVAHAYQLSLIRSSKKNPYVEGIEWHSAFSHGRTCELCKQRHGQIFSKEDCPLDHPQGLCTLIPYIPKDLDEVAGELRDWLDGKASPELDSWYQMYGQEFASGSSVLGNVNQINKENIRNSNLKPLKDAIISVEESIKQDIKSGKHNLKLNLISQNKHIVGKPQYTEGRSIVTISIEEAQELINKHAGTGELIIIKGEWKNKERILGNDKIIGVYKNIDSGEEMKTSNFMIHYNDNPNKKQKNGTHIVPSKP